VGGWEGAQWTSPCGLGDAVRTTSGVATVSWGSARKAWKFGRFERRCARGGTLARELPGVAKGGCRGLNQKTNKGKKRGTIKPLQGAAREK